MLHVQPRAGEGQSTHTTINFIALARLFNGLERPISQGTINNTRRRIEVFNLELYLWTC